MLQIVGYSLRTNPYITKSKIFGDNSSPAVGTKSNRIIYSRLLLSGFINKDYTAISYTDEVIIWPVPPPLKSRLYLPFPRVDLCHLGRSAHSLLFADISDVADQDLGLRLLV